MLSILSRSLRKICDSLGLGTPHNRSRAREAPNHRTKGRENMKNLRKTSLIQKPRRTMERRIKTPGSGATSIRSLGITLLIIAQKFH
jgi:hypothetical protein